MVGFIKLEDLKSWKRIACLISVIGALQFIFITIIAMVVYPGGYSFLEYTFSYLGFEVSASNGAENTVARVLFIIACSIAAFFLVPFWIVIPSLFTDKNITKYLSLLGSACGVASAPFLVLLAIFAGDTHFSEHIITTNIFFLFFAAGIVIYSIAILLNEDYQNIYAYIGIIFSIHIVLYILLFRNIDLIRASTQRVIAYGFCLWVAYQATKVWKVVSPVK